MRDELDRLRADGLFIGFTATGPRQRDTIERAVAVGGFDAVQATWNLLEPSAGPALAAAHEAGLGVIVKEAVANGRLTARGESRSCSPPPAGSASPPTRWRWPPCWPSHGSMSCSAGPPPRPW